MTDEKKVNIGVIGAGWWAAFNHVPVLKKHPKVDLIAVSSREQEKLDKFKNSLGIENTYLDEREMLNRHNFNGLIVSSPHIAHYENALLGLEKGCHLLVEKPFTTKAKEAKILERTSKEKGLDIIISNGWNFNTIIKKAFELVERIGEIEHATCLMASALSDLFSGEEFAETEGHLIRPTGSTWSDPEKAGGYAYGQLSHILAAFFLLVPQDPKDVIAYTTLSKANVDFHDAAIVRLTNGAKVIVSGSSSSPSSKGFLVDIRIFGKKGILLLDLERARLEVICHDGWEYKETLDPNAGEYDCSLPVNALVDRCIGKSEYNFAPADMGRRTVQVIEGMMRSAQSGKVEVV